MPTKASEILHLHKVCARNVRNGLSGCFTAVIKLPTGANTVDILLPKQETGKYYFFCDTLKILLRIQTVSMLPIETFLRNRQIDFYNNISENY